MNVDKNIETIQVCIIIENYMTFTPMMDGYGVRRVKRSGVYFMQQSGFLILIN